MTPPPGSTPPKNPPTSDLMDDRRCKALSKRSGERCRRFPIPGGTVCVMHGGASPKVRAAAERRRVRQQATKLLEVIWDEEAPPITDPIVTLQELLGRHRHALNVLGARLDGDDLDETATSAFIRLARELRQGLEGMEKLDLSSKRVQLESDKVRLIAVAVGAMFDALNLTADQRELGQQVLMDALRAEVARGELQ